MSRQILEGELLDPGRLAGPGRLVWSAGRIEECSPLAPGTPSAPEARRLPPGCLLLPGFVDAHTHLIGLGFEFLRPNFAAARSREEVYAILAAWLDDHPGDEPVIGEGWDQSLWADPAPPRREDLDRVAPRRRVFLRRVCGHVGVANSRALEDLGSKWDGLDQETGLALEALPLSISRRWPASAEQMDEAVRLGQEEAWRRGVTGIHEMGHAGTFRAFGRADAGGRLQLRVTHFFAAELLEAIEAAGLSPGLGGGRLRVGGIKLFLDGSIGGRSAAVRTPYPAPPGGREDGSGLLLWTDEKLRTVLRRAFAGGFQPAMHAIGDRAIEQALAAVETLRAEGAVPPPPGPRIEHAEMLDAGLLERARRAGCILSMQPNFTARWQNPGELYDQILGPDRARALNPFRAARATGRLVFGSDTMPLDPLLGLRGACRHPVAAERLDFAEAVACYTGAAAAAVTHPFGNGSLAAGAPADFVLLRRRKSAPGEIDPRDLEVAAVWVGGTLRHADAPFRAGGEVALE